MSDYARILIVDDSRIFRCALEEALNGQEGVAVVGSVFSGEKALDFIRASPPDLVTLDVEMPGLGGLQTLEAIQEINRSRSPGTEIGVLMISAFTKRGADITVRALQAGAFDFITKPVGPSADANLLALRQELLTKIKMFAVRRQRHGVRLAVPAASRPVIPLAASAASVRAAQAILIASSTGGPRALSVLLPDLASRMSLPILIVQHMPPELTTSLAENLARQTRCRVVEARDGELIESGSVYLAAGGKHLLIRAGAGGKLRIGTTDQPSECGCRPSANVLFRSAAAVLAGRAIAIVLTGMGNDGAAGVAPLKRAGAYVIAQDEATSVVWGMPGSVVAAGLADAVLPLDAIAPAVQSLLADNVRKSAGSERGT